MAYNSPVAQLVERVAVKFAKGEFAPSHAEADFVRNPTGAYGSELNWQLLRETVVETAGELSAYALTCFGGSTVVHQM